MKIFLSAAVIGLILCGCSQSSGVLKMGPDTYTVSVHAAPIRGGESGARKIALTEASNKCVAEGGEILVTNIESKPSSHLAGGTVNLTFRCLSANDPDLKRPEYKPAPNVVIEDKR